MPSVGRPTHSRPLLALAIAFVSMAVHWHALFMFFSADDLVHLQQACGLMPTPLVPWRPLTQVGYFRLMLWLVGPWPAPFMFVNMTLHGLNATLLFGTLTRRGIALETAALAAVLFGACPLLSTVVGHAVVINDIAALTFGLIALDAFARGGRSGPWLGTLAFVVALACKESVLFLPLLAAVPLAGDAARPRLRPLIPVMGVIAAVSLLFLTARAHQAAPSGWAYALSPWPAPFHNLMTYTRWFVALHQPLPDLVRTPDPHAWHVALPVLIVLGWVAARSRDDGHGARFGLAWWGLGLLPVLPLSHSAYAHYAYVALPGIALAVASALHALASRLGLAQAADLGDAVAPARRWAVIASLLALLYAARAEVLVSQRFTLRLEGIDLPLDPQIRSMVVAGRAVYSLGSTPPPPHTRLAIFAVPGRARIFGTRTGREYGVRQNVSVGYDLHRVVLSDGRALRVFFPQLDTVAYVTHWSRGLKGFAAATRSAEGEITYYGAALDDQLRLARDLSKDPAGAVATEFIDSLRVVYPNAPALAALADSVASSADSRTRR